LPQAGGATIPAGSKVFISEMPDGLDGYIRAEIMKKKVPLTVVLTDGPPPILCASLESPLHLRHMSQNSVSVRPRDGGAGVRAA
jgi:hypothetical protein